MIGRAIGRLAMGIAAALVSGVSSLGGQVPTKLGQLPSVAPVVLPPAISVYAKCLRPDVAQSRAAISAALSAPLKPGAAPADVVEPQREVAGCTYYKVSLASTMTVEDTEDPRVTSTIRGSGSITFGLAPDDAEAGYDFTSGVQDLTAPIYWEKGSARITRPDCIVNTVELPYTPFAFWLGVTTSGSQKIGVRISPADMDLHSTATRCKDPLGRWHDLAPAQEAIFTPAWIKLHGEGKNAAPQTADQQAVNQTLDNIVKAGPKPGAKIKPSSAYAMPALPSGLSPTGTMAMDPAKLQAMQDYMVKHPNATPAEMMKMMAGAVPNLGQQLAAAEDNFMFTEPGECRTPVSTSKTICVLPSAAVTMKDRTGYGTIKKITEQTTITIEKVGPPL